VHLNLLFTILAALVVFTVGRLLVARTPFLQRFSIPPPVVGGVLVAILVSRGTTVFLALLLLMSVSAQESAGWSIGTTFLLRLAAVTFNWKTRAARPLLGKRAS
jgi:Na+/glutamate symporter